MDYTSIWKTVKAKGLEIGLEENYFTHFDQADSSTCKLSNVGLKRCSYFFDLTGQAGCFIAIAHSNEGWNKKVYDLVHSCQEELEKAIGIPLEFRAETYTFGLNKHPKDETIEYTVEQTNTDEMALHLLRCFYLLLEEVDHVVKNAMEEVY